MFVRIFVSDYRMEKISNQHPYQNTLEYLAFGSILFGSPFGLEILTNILTKILKSPYNLITLQPYNPITLQAHNLSRNPSPSTHDAYLRSFRGIIRPDLCVERVRFMRRMHVFNMSKIAFLSIEMPETLHRLLSSEPFKYSLPCSAALVVSSLRMRGTERPFTIPA